MAGLATGTLLLGGSLLGFLGYPDYGMVLVVSCGVYVVCRNRLQISEGQEGQAAVFRPIIAIVFFAVISLGLALLKASLYGRVTLFFLLTALAAGIVAWEIVSFPVSRRTRNLLLGQIFVLFLVLRLSLFEQFPSSMLGIDPWYHFCFLTNIASKGEISLSSQYGQFPAMHIVAVSFWEIAHVDLRVSFILTSTLFGLVCFLFTFALAQSLTDSRVALVCVLLLTILQSSIRWGWWITPNTVGLYLLPMIVYAVVARKPKQATQYQFITILTLVLLIVTHAFSTFVILVVLTLLYLASRLPRLRFSDMPKSVGLGFLLLVLYGLLFLSYWIFGLSQFYWWKTGPIAGFFGEIVMVLEYGFRFMRQVFAPALSFSELLVTRSGPAVMLAFAILGSLIMLSPRHGSSKRFTLSLAGLALIALAFGLQALGLDELLPGRWIGFAQYLTMVPASIGIYSASLLVRRFGARRLLIVALILSIAVVNIMAPEASFDSPLATRRNSYRWGLLVSEMSGANFLAEVYKGPILTDEYFRQCPALCDRDARGLRPEEVRANASIGTTQMLMLRKYVETAGIMVFTERAEGFLQLAPDYENTFCSSSRWNKMYSSNTLSGYVLSVPSP
jgi:hypothetical protein